MTFSRNALLLSALTSLTACLSPEEIEARKKEVEEARTRITSTQSVQGSDTLYKATKDDLLVIAPCGCILGDALADNKLVLDTVNGRIDSNFVFDRQYALNKHILR